MLVSSCKAPVLQSEIITVNKISFYFIPIKHIDLFYFFVDSTKILISCVVSDRLVARKCLKFQFNSIFSKLSFVCQHNTGLFFQFYGPE